MGGSFQLSSGWWFGCHFLFSHILGIIIPIDFHIFQRGSNHQPVLHRLSSDSGMSGCNGFPVCLLQAPSQATKQMLLARKTYSLDLFSHQIQLQWLIYPSTHVCSWFIHMCCSTSLSMYIYVSSISIGAVSHPIFFELFVSLHITLQHSSDVHSFRMFQRFHLQICGSFSPTFFVDII